MNLFHKLVRTLDHYKLIDLALIVSIAVMVVIFKMNKAGQLF